MNIHHGVVLSQVTFQISYRRRGKSICWSNSTNFILLKLQAILICLRLNYKETALCCLVTASQCPDHVGLADQAIGPFSVRCANNMTVPLEVTSGMCHLTSCWSSSSPARPRAQAGSPPSCESRQNVGDGLLQQPLWHHSSAAAEPQGANKDREQTHSLWSTGGERERETLTLTTGAPLHLSKYHWSVHRSWWLPAHGTLESSLG